jgi:hypothetical protein
MDCLKGIALELVLSHCKSPSSHDLVKVDSSLRREASVGLGELAKLDQFIVVHVRPILRDEQILVDPECSNLRENDRAVLVLL